MKNNINDYLSFMESSEVPSSDLDQLVRTGFQDQQRERWKYFLLKFVVIHLSCGLITFYFCPQFGLNPFKSSTHLPHIFMSYGVWACGLFCGSVFMGSGALIRLLFFNERERIFADQAGLKLTLGLSSVLYGALMLVGSHYGSIVLNYSVVFFVFWLLGALLFERGSNFIVNKLLIRTSSLSQ